MDDTRAGQTQHRTRSRNSIEVSAAALPERPWLDIDQAAAYLRTSKRTVYKLCALFKLVYYVSAGVRWFTKDDLDAYIASGRVDVYGRRGRGRKTA